MNISRYINYLPYKAGWWISKLFSHKKKIDFFCAGHVDYVCFQSIHKKLPYVRIVAKNRKIQKELLKYNINSVLYPTFPDLVIMARHSARKYPEKKIKKIGLRHGAYHFKDFINARYYNEFDKYFMTSSHEVSLGEKKGITSGVAVGYPKIDCMFNGEITEEMIQSLKSKINLDNNKKTVLFTATWNKKGYSAIDKWVNRVGELSDEYNVLVTVHQWTTSDKIQILETTKNIHFIKDKFILPYLMIADVMIADISSIIAEFNALNKPIVTYIVPHMKRFTEEISTMLNQISYRVKDFDEMKEAIKTALQYPDEHSSQRQYYNKIMFDNLDGKATDRAVKEILDLWEKI